MVEFVPLHVHLFDDNILHQHGLAGLLADVPGVKWSSSSMLEELEGIKRAPDLTLVHLNHASYCSHYLLGTLLKRMAQSLVMGFSMHPVKGLESLIEIEQGRLRLATYEELVERLSEYVSVIRLRGGWPSLDPGLEKGSPNASELSRLSPRERDVFCLVGKGLGAVEISEAVGCGVRTVETHLRKIRDSLQVGNLVEMRRLAITFTHRGHCRVFSGQEYHRCPHTGRNVGQCSFL